MPVYRAPLDDYRFVMQELLEVEKHRDLPQFQDLSPDTIEDVLTNAAKFCAQLRGATATGAPDCSFSTLEACRARVRHRGGGHCYKLH